MNEELKEKLKKQFPVTVIRCNCCPTCRTHYISFGSFYQGCGWYSQEEAQFVADAINEALSK